MPFWKAQQFSLSAWTSKPKDMAYDVGNPTRATEKQNKKAQVLLDNDEIYQSTPQRSLKMDDNFPLPAARPGVAAGGGAAAAAVDEGALN